MTAKVEIGANTLSEKATREWFLTIDVAGEQHLIVLPYETYAHLVKAALGRLTAEEIHAYIRGDMSAGAAACLTGKDDVA
jgi:hypothetical protein